MNSKKLDPRTIIEKLNLIKRMQERNEQRRKEFAAKQAAKQEYNEMLFDLYAEAKISRDEFERRFKK